MRPTKLTPYGWLVLALLATTLALAACQSPIDNPYGAGQQFRQQMDVLLEDASQFLAGFCGTTPAALLAGLAAMLYLGRRSS
ncbi:MAG TPA: hypothetical protein VL334_07950 [Anaerolineae bacterium]|nr:hypothetical protein [Anaerolineae bacterium]